MFDGVRGLFVRAVGDGHDPKTIPQHYVKFYDQCVRMYQKFGHYQGVEDIPFNDWPMICILADMESRLQALEKRPTTSEVSCQIPSEGASRLQEDEPRRVDMRTKEGRALKESMTQEALMAGAA